MQSSYQPNQPPGFSTEVWREIAMFLPRRDLKMLLLLPHVLSRIASQLLFRKIDLHFGADSILFVYHNLLTRAVLQTRSMRSKARTY